MKMIIFALSQIWLRHLDLSIHVLHVLHKICHSNADFSHSCHICMLRNMLPVSIACLCFSYSNYDTIWIFFSILRNHLVIWVLLTFQVHWFKCNFFLSWIPYGSLLDYVKYAMLEEYFGKWIPYLLIPVFFFLQFTATYEKISVIYFSTHLDSFLRKIYLPV